MDCVRVEYRPPDPDHGTSTFSFRLPDSRRGLHTTGEKFASPLLSETAIKAHDSDFNIELRDLLLPGEHPENPVSCATGLFESPATHFPHTSTL
jgi:hypothetical protein